MAGAEELSQWIERFRRNRSDLAPVELLKGEHHIIRAVLDALERVSARVSAGQAVDGDYWHRAVDFVEHFVDRCHHQKEEEVLFPLLLGQARSERVGPIVALKHEHVEGRALKESLCDAAEGRDPEQLVEAAATYIQRLREHMDSEEQGLFEVDRRIPAGETERMGDEFARVERNTLGVGGYDRYLELAAGICGEAESQGRS